MSMSDASVATQPEPIIIAKSHWRWMTSIMSITHCATSGAA